MPRPRKEAGIADFSLVGRILAETGILRTSNTPHQETNRPQYDTCDVATRSEGWLWLSGNVWGVGCGDWHVNYPDLDHLEDPKPKEREKLVALVVEAVIFASLGGAEKEEAGEAGAPERDEEGVDSATSMVVIGESKGYYGKENRNLCPLRSLKGPKC
jgi:hypothetical protein